MKRIQQGFTLIELMIVVAIVGILAAIAIPAYQDFLIRSKVTEVAAALGACKTSVAEYYGANNATFPANVDQSGCNTTATKFLSKLDVTAVTGVITGTIQGTNNGLDPDKKDLLLTPIVDKNNMITEWSCSTSAMKKFAPATCRG